MIFKTKYKIPAIGQGTMGIGGYFKTDYSQDASFVKALKVGIKAGLFFIDTAEAYGGGHSEELVGLAIKKNRKNTFVATKISPEHLSYKDVIHSAESSLKRLQTDYLDLYQIHWPNPEIPLEETLRAMKKLVNDGKIIHIGVSNFSLAQLKLANKILSPFPVFSNQVEYNLFDRTIEKDLLPYCEEKDILLIAYSPLDHGKINKKSKNEKIMQNLTKKYNKSATQIILNWLISKKSVIAIPKASKVKHIQENAASVDFKLTTADIDLINRAFKEPVVNILPSLVKVDKKGLKLFNPGPQILAKQIKVEKNIKPIRVIKNIDSQDKNKYILVEGKLRYWAWFEAFNGEKSIPALIRNNS